LNSNAYRKATKTAADGVSVARSDGKAWQKVTLESAGLAVLYVLPIADGFVKTWHVNSFHHAHPVGSIPRAIFFLTLLVWVLAWFVIAALDRLPRRGRNVAWIALSVLLVWLLGRIGAVVFGAHPAMALRTLLLSHIGVICLPIALLLVWRARPKILQQVFGAVGMVFTIAAFGMIILLPKLAWQAFRFEAPEQTSFVNPLLQPATSPQRRIVWILMDELSYHEVFERPPSGLTFPNLERFAQHSTTFSNLQPTGYHTEEVIPGLILGQPVADVEHIYGRPFRFRSTYRGAWHPYDPARTLFGEAHPLGWTTGIAAWFNPYCRFLPGVLDRCFWQDTDVYPGLPVKLYYNRSTLANLWALLPPHEHLDPLAIHRIDHETHMHDYADVMTQSESLLRDRRIRFVMLHLPVPHPPGIYNRGSHALAPAGNYIDNLALADDTLGRLMKTIQSTPDADETTVIVSSDHSWRVAEWKKLSDWTPEEGQISGERFDPRPVLMVHLPGSEEGRAIARPTSLMVVHSIIDAMLRGKAETPEAIAALAAAEPAITVPEGGSASRGSPN
jgi:sulfatase-like protein